MQACRCGAALYARQVLHAAHVLAAESILLAAAGRGLARMPGRAVERFEKARRATLNPNASDTGTALADAFTNYNKPPCPSTSSIPHKAVSRVPRWRRLYAPARHICVAIPS